MLKKMVVVMAILVMAGTVFGGWSADKFGALPSPTIPDPCNPGKTLPNPLYTGLYGTDRTVDWERGTGGDDGSFQRKGEVWNWPSTYDYVQICDIKVQMDVGFWIKVRGCAQAVITLKQRMINQYGGETKCWAQTNVATQWKADFVKKDGVSLGGYDKSASVSPSTFDATGTSEKELTVKLKMWDVSLAQLTPGIGCVEIGWVRLSVRPTVKPNVFMSGCSGTYPVYSPPPVDSTITWW